MKLWNKIPAIIRSIIIGFLIQIIGVIPLFVLIQKNIEVLPSFPWAPLVIGLILYVFWKFLTGQKFIFPASTTRADLSRTNKPKAMTLSMITGFFLLITLIAFVFIGYMLAVVPLQQVELLTNLKGIPLWTSLSLLFIASFATGIVEELAWRGYAQRIIEKKHPALLAICAVALIFTIIHFLPLPVWPLFFLGSLGWGFLAYYSKSIIPGIVFHTLIDLIAFIWALFNIEKLKEILEYNIFEDGINSLFLILITIALVSMLLTIISLLKLKKLNAYTIN